MITRTKVDNERMRIRASIASDVCMTNVWNKFPTDDDHDLFVWQDNRCNVIAKKYIQSLNSYDIDESERIYEQLMSSCKGLMDLFEWKKITTMPYYTYASMLTDIFEYNESA